MKTITMSGKEISRLEVMLGDSARHIKRLLKVYRKKGTVELISKHRGRKGNPLSASGDETKGAGFAEK